MRYRPEIDGLRAFAVISVIIYHAEFLVGDQKWLTGGYIGVDIFFVLSGYLITRILLKELHNSNGVSILKFYERRARRILPMLFTVILASMPFAYLILLPEDLIEYSQSIFSSLLFVSNFFFYFATTEYGADSSLLKPFLHTWSLSIEEQFYIVFPVMLAIIFRINKNRILHVFSVLFVISLVYSNFAQQQNPDLNFYLPMSRAWELLAGSILAYWEMKHGVIRDHVVNKWAPVLGLVMMCVPFVTFDSETAHPGFVTLIPVVGVSLIIAFSSSTDIVGRMLSSPLLRGIGLISYSAYLWHFPIFAFARYTDSDPTSIDKLVWIVLTITLSIASFWWIEKPTRNRKILNVSGLATVLILPFGAMLAFNGKVINENGFADRLPQIFAEDFSQKPWEISKNIDGTSCYGSLNFCEFDSPGDQKVFIVGDSTIESISHSLYPALVERGYDVILMNSASCYFAPEFYSSKSWRVPREVPNQPCDLDYQSRRIDLIKQHPGSIIILGGNLNSYIYNSVPGSKRLGFSTDTDVSFTDNLKTNVEELLHSGYTVVQLYPQPTALKPHGIEVQKLLNRNPDASREEIVELQSYEHNTFKSGTRPAYEFLDSIDSPNFIRVYPERAFCDTILESRCVFSDGDALYLVDQTHVARRGGELISHLVIEAFDEL